MANINVLCWDKKKKKKKKKRGASKHVVNVVLVLELVPFFGEYYLAEKFHTNSFMKLHTFLICMRDRDTL